MEKCIIISISEVTLVIKFPGEHADSLVQNSEM